MATLSYAEIEEKCLYWSRVELMCADWANDYDIDVSEEFRVRLLDYCTEHTPELSTLNVFRVNGGNLPKAENLNHDLNKKVKKLNPTVPANIFVDQNSQSVSSNTLRVSSVNSALFPTYSVKNAVALNPPSINVADAAPRPVIMEAQTVNSLRGHKMVRVDSAPIQQLMEVNTLDEKVLPLKPVIASPDAPKSDITTEAIKPVEPASPVTPVEPAKPENVKSKQASSYSEIVNQNQRVNDIVTGGIVSGVVQAGIESVKVISELRQGDNKVSVDSAASRILRKGGSGFVTGAEISAVITATNSIEGMIIVFCIETGQLILVNSKEILKGKMTLSHFIDKLYAEKKASIAGLSFLSLAVNNVNKSNVVISATLCTAEIVKLLWNWKNGKIKNHELVQLLPTTVGSFGTGAAAALAGAAYFGSMAGVYGALLGAVVCGLFGSTIGGFIGNETGSFLVELFKLDPIRSAYGILKSSPRDSNSTLRRKYYAIQREVHPDRHRGDADPKQAYWTNVSANVTAAYELLVITREEEASANSKDNE